jgi:hypothetical protein
LVARSASGILVRADVEAAEYPVDRLIWAQNYSSGRSRWESDYSKELER